MSGTQTASIPLYIFPNTGGGYKIGISVSLNGGQSYQMYEFDTGGQGFWSAYNSSWFSNPVMQNDMTASNTYSSGITYQAQVASEPISFNATVNNGTLGSTSTLLTVNSGTVAAIEYAAKPTNPDPFTNAQFQADISSTPTPIPPIYNTFFGDFGMALGSSSQGLFAILPQLTGYSNGFIINLGTYPTSNTPINGQGYVQVGTLQVGLTPQEIASFPTLISMQGMNTGTVFPNSGEPTYQERLAAGTYSVGGSSFPTSFVFDTGAPTTEIHANGSQSTFLAPFTQDGTLETGTQFTASSPGQVQPVPPGTLTADWLLQFLTGNTVGANEAGVDFSDSNGTGYVNTGLVPFFQGEVMYDVADGLIGFKPAVACFAAGTRIATPSGEVRIEALRAGDLVTTASGEARPIIWIGRRRVDCRYHPSPEEIQPIRIRAHAFGPGEPRRDLLLSPDHALYREGVLIPVKYLINGESVAQVNVREVMYFHIELERHDVVLANGLAAETYLDVDDRGAFTNGGAVTVLHPIFGGETSLRWEADGCAPLIVRGEQVERTRDLLASRLRRNSRIA